MSTESITDLPQLTSVPKLAAASGMSRVTIQKAIKQGRLPGSFKLGNNTSHWLIPRESAIAFLTGQAPQPVEHTTVDEDSALK
jgi:predicted DNA-binding transcriptional regulator AlpA